MSTAEDKGAIAEDGATHGGAGKRTRTGSGDRRPLFGVDVEAEQLRSGRGWGVY